MFYPSRPSALLISVTLLVLSAPCYAQDGHGDGRPFYRVIEDIDPENPMAEIKHRVGKEYRNVFPLVAPYRSGRVQVPVDGQNTFLLGDALRDFTPSDRTYGIAVAIDSDFGRQYHYFLLEEPDGLEELRQTRLFALPSYLESMQGQALEQVDVYVAEALELPQERSTGPIRIPENGRLAFGLAFEDPLQDAPVRTVSALGLGDNKDTSPLRIEVLAVGGGEEVLVFDRDIRPAEDPKVRRWTDQTADLGSLAGRTVRLVFRFSPPEGSNSEQSPFSLPLVSSPIVYRNADRSITDRRNLILISLDTLRADHLGCYGYGRDTSPNLDAFAQEAYLFEDCISTSAWTMPAHASVFTGLPLSLHRAGTPDAWRVRTSLTTLSELARSQGYLTAAFTEGVVVGGGFGFLQGFERYSDGPDPEITPRPGRAEKTFAAGRAWLEQFGHLPFLLFLHTYEVHSPYHPPEGFGGRYTDLVTAGYTPMEEQVSPDERAHVIGLYDEGIRYTDHVLGELLEWLEESGLTENTAIVIFSDHGEEFWEHGGYTHGKTLYQEMLHVPLFVKLPGRSSGGARIAERVSLADVYATSVELLDLDATIPEDSISILPLTVGGALAKERSVVRSELYQNVENFYLVSGLSGDYKFVGRTELEDPNSLLHGQRIDRDALATGVNELDFVRSLVRPGARERVAVQKTGNGEGPSESELLYDLNADPSETQPIQGAQPGALEELRAALIREMERSTEFAREQAMEAERAQPLSDAEKDQLRALGYVN